MKLENINDAETDVLKTEFLVKMDEVIEGLREAADGIIGLPNNYDEIRRNVQDAFDRTNELLDKTAKEHK